LPFRGGLTPERVEDFSKEYKGIRTTTIQSAFRYDYPLEKVQSAVAFLEKNLSEAEAVTIDKTEEKKLLYIISEAEKRYKEIIEQIAPIVNVIASSIPQRRERFLHIGLFGYSRGEGKVKLPRAISFTCALYSLGIPPEFIGTGQAIQYAKKHNLLQLLETYYVNMKKDLVEAGRFLNKSNLEKLARNSSAWKAVGESIRLIEEYTSQKLGPQTPQEKRHADFTKKILVGLSKKESVSQYIKQAAIIRKSLG
ncbi:MAG TPA: phosphoenolpyruvate carboxylase, partial [Candidatus Saccharimonadales bacterium]|nr:phosphoenolpyruvate carboxylase [Candidatus Saccharimonadales bacterium]